MNNVLSVTFPQPVPLFLDFVSFIFLDARKLIRLECAKRVFLMPIFQYSCWFAKTEQIP